ncbi:hypothetical protein, partial [Bartonella sp. MR168JLCBS]|uniref:hypothetical protein n=1 Tax=Bartonella sp. MR168JLCBS TaxID=3243556 RepID=UPI0035D06DB5
LMDSAGFNSNKHCWCFCCGGCCGQHIPPGYNSSREGMYGSAGSRTVFGSADIDV